MANLRGAAARFLMRKQIEPTPKGIRPNPAYTVEFYEGLVRKTAGRIAPHVENEYDDLCSLYRIKVWQALQSFDPAKSKVPIENYVFSCMVNLTKDLRKKLKRYETYIEDHCQGPGADDGSRVDAFHEKYLSVDDDDLFTELASWESFRLPSTINEQEQRVLLLLYHEYSYAEVALRLGITKQDVTACAKSIRDKMEDWRPSRAAVQAPPERPLRASQKPLWSSAPDLPSAA